MSSIFSIQFDVVSNGLTQRRGSKFSSIVVLVVSLEICLSEVILLWTWAEKSQLEAYKKRKKLLHKKMMVGTVGMCFLIVLLTWSRWYLPYKNYKFWNSDDKNRCQNGFYKYKGECLDMNECENNWRNCAASKCVNTVGKCIVLLLFNGISKYQ